MLSGDFKTNDMCWTWIVVAAVVAWLVWKLFVDKNVGVVEPFGTGRSRNNKIQYIFSPSCPHCVEFRPTWTSVTAKVATKYPDAQILSTNVDDEDTADLLPPDYPGYIPVVYINGVEYKGPRTVPAILAEVNRAFSTKA